MRNEELTCGHFVNPFTDIGFKIIFGQPWKNRSMLLHQTS